MFRLILWIIFLYLLWRFLRTMIPLLQRVLRSSERRMDGSPEQSAPKVQMEFKDVKDAEFKEIPTDPNQKSDGTSS